MLQELREQYGQLTKSARDIMDKIDAEKREASAEENAQVDKLFAEADVVQAKLETAKRKDELAKRENNRPQTRTPNDWLGPKVKDISYRSVLDSWMRGEGNRRLVAHREMGKDQATAGADSVTWTDFYANIFEELKYYTPLFDLVTIIPSDNGNTLPIVTLDDTGSVAEIIGESTAVAAADPVIDRVDLGSFKYSSKEILFSLELEQDSSFPLVSTLEAKIADRFGRKWASDMTVGAGGGNLPYGLVTRAASASVQFGATLTFDKLLDLKYAVDLAYHKPAAGFMMHPTTFVAVRKLKNDENDYIFQPDLTLAGLGRIDGSPVYLNSFMASTGSNAKAVLYGDYTAYVWRTIKSIELYRLNELYIEQALFGLIAFARADGNLILPNAVKYATLAT